MRREDVVREAPDTAWAEGPTRGVEDVVESGQVLALPRLAFAVAPGEDVLFDPRRVDADVKNISVRWPGGELRGATGGPAEREAMRRFVVRYAEASEALVSRLFPHYRGKLVRGSTSFRPFDVVRRAQRWRQDDTRLHVDAFPSNPMRGARLLRVFCNVNRQGEPRRWRVGEPFEAHARRYADRVGRPLPGSAAVLAALGITKRRRTAYDHAMLRLHDLAKADAAFQRESPQVDVAFAPGTTWVCFSDQLLHAAMGGQHLLEQTFLLEPADLKRPETAPIAILGRLGMLSSTNDEVSARTP